MKVAAIFQGLEEGQGVMASSWYAIDAREVASVEDAYDIGPEGQEPAVFWVYDKAAYLAYCARERAAQEVAIRYDIEDRNRGRRISRHSHEYEVDGFTIHISESWGERTASTRKGTPNWKDYVVKEMRTK